MTKSGIARVSGKLNKIDDANPGGSPLAAPEAPSYVGQLGAFAMFDDSNVPYDSTVGTLYDGQYQYVRFLAGSTAAPARGGVVYWNDKTNFVVTPDAPATFVDPAGVALNAVTKGNYGWILVEGQVQLHGLVTITKVAPAIGDNAILTSTANACDDVLDVTAFDGTNLKKYIGQWLEAPVSAAGGGFYKASVLFRKNGGQ